MLTPADIPDRIVQIDELFFSTTDRRGVITGANTVFGDLSHYTRAELIGAPHNIVRHPEMPGGAFAIMWDRLLSGHPMVAYVKNLAKDGSAYWVFATITPLDDGFLSVRVAPCRQDLWDAAWDVYQEVLPIEQHAREEGLSRAGAARVGAEAIVARLAGLGFADYGEFLRYVLPAEVTARAALTRLSTERPDITGELGTLHGAAHALGVELASLLVRLDGYLELADSLRSASQGAVTTLAGLSAAAGTASRASSTVAASAPVLARTASAMSVLSEDLRTQIQALARRLDDVHVRVMELRFRIGLAALHNDMVTSFALEVHAGEAPPEALSYIPQLCRALEEGTENVTASLTRTNAELRDVADRVIDAEARLHEFQHLLATWRLLVTRYQMSRQLGPHVGPIDDQLRAGSEQLISLRNLARQCLAEALPYDTERLREPVGRVARAGDDLHR
ncbi:MAG TPA: PAS domain-containing protein [Cellulomonadaceae bacterium]|nr:PAS domain-containing protein [Cellulomonadaceae bacterium]